MSNTFIRKTVDINIRNLARFEALAEEKKMPISDIMNMILDKHIKMLANNPQKNSHAMKYQKRGTSYVSRHIRLSQIAYSRLRDIMILFRYTLSYLLSLAMECFGEYRETFQESDWRQSSVHSVVVTDVGCVKLFASYWGVPFGRHEIEIPG